MNSIIKGDMDQLIDSCEYSDELRDKTVLVTGATGLIAKNLTYFLLEMNRQKGTNINVLALVRNLEKAQKSFSDYSDDDHFKFINQDVCEPINYEGPIDYIFHAAGSASAFAIKSNPVGIIRANTVGTMNVLELARKSGAKKVIFPSTREIYGKVDGKEKITETDMGVMDPLDSRSCYPESKRLGEAIFKSYSEQYHVPFNVLRIAHTYGPAMGLGEDGRVMADFMEAVVNDRDIILNSDGTARRSFCYVSDTIKGIMDVMMKGTPGEAYNLSNEREPYMIRDVAQMLVDMYPNKGIKLQFTNPSDEIKKGYIGYKITQLDTSKIESLGWEPKVKLEEGLQRTVDYFEEEKKLIRKM